ncbi:16S rRNA (guanine(966)-N(2))-methyltransferase RsmD [Thalassotalea psychrophila]|uniref:Ribosomal RNA small subunit methyltransferase D n=1 Tax=Thalassotalea psychrophila TaxID=3065647 RepID=A0ABY9TXQ4_9GAMM|nr:16S rRNA (guanine(966)-N(2))-methyltransferase RsmD [Colwelliaceae bacterium SQ149]
MTKNRKSTGQNQQTGQVRIIAGQFRGRKLPVIMADGLRPTTDRVKETVFNWLMPHLYNAKCLDCFAGSGSLGFEALSRGVSSTQFYELNATAAKKIQENIQLLKANNAQISKGSCLQLLETEQQQFDLVFIDPPFRKGFVAQTAELLETKQLLTDEAIIYVEVESELTDLQLPINWQLLKEKISGQVAYRLYQRS